MGSRCFQSQNPLEICRGIFLLEESRTAGVGCAFIGPKRKNRQRAKVPLSERIWQITS